jgi:hypothetical protein
MVDVEMELTQTKQMPMSLSAAIKDKNLSMKEGSLFVLFCFVCTYEIHQIMMFQITFLVSLESYRGRGVY